MCMHVCVSWQQDLVRAYESMCMRACVCLCECVVAQDLVRAQVCVCMRACMYVSCGTRSGEGT